MNSNPIGIFDSGVGGLSVWKEVAALMPNENIIYLADSANCPYGSKTHDEIIELSIKNTEFLLQHHCKIIIVACNTATAAAIDTLRESYALPFIGMEPAIKPAAKNTNTGKIGVLATHGTFNGRLFKQTSKKYAAHVHKFIQIGEGLVELVENGETNSEKASDLLKKYLNPMIEANVDQIVLGCTHYPFLSKKIKEIIPPSIRIVNPAPAVAERTKSVIMENKMENTSHKTEYRFYSSGNSNTLKNLIFEITNKEYFVEKVN